MMTHDVAYQATMSKDCGEKGVSTVRQPFLLFSLQQVQPPTVQRAQTDFPKNMIFFMLNKRLMVVDLLEVLASLEPNLAKPSI